MSVQGKSALLERNSRPSKPDHHGRSVTPGPSPKQEQWPVQPAAGHCKVEVQSTAWPGAGQMLAG